jgi:hypothetical protein
LGRRKQRGQQDDQIHEAIRDAGSQHVGEFAPLAVIPPAAPAK